MGKEEFVAAKAAEIAALQQQAVVDGLGAAWDESALEQKASDGTLGQADLDKAVSDALAAAKLVSDQALADAVAAAQAVDVKAMSEAKAVADAAMLDMQAKFDALAAKEGQESQVIAGLQASKDALSAALQTLAGLFPVPPAA